VQAVEAVGSMYWIFSRGGGDKRRVIPAHE